MSRNRTKYPIPFLWKPRDAGDFGNTKAQLSLNRCGVTNFYFIKVVEINDSDGPVFPRSPERGNADAL